MGFFRTVAARLREALERGAGVLPPRPPFQAGGMAFELVFEMSLPVERSYSLPEPITRINSPSSTSDSTANSTYRIAPS